MPGSAGVGMVNKTLANRKKTNTRTKKKMMKKKKKPRKREKIAKKMIVKTVWRKSPCVSFAGEDQVNSREWLTRGTVNMTTTKNRP